MCLSVIHIKFCFPRIHMVHEGTTRSAMFLVLWLFVFHWMHCTHKPVVVCHCIKRRDMTSVFACSPGMYFLFYAVKTREVMIKVLLVRVGVGSKFPFESELTTCYPEKRTLIVLSKVNMSCDILLQWSKKWNVCRLFMQYGCRIFIQGCNAIVKLACPSVDFY